MLARQYKTAVPCFWKILHICLAVLNSGSEWLKWDCSIPFWTITIYFYDLCINYLGWQTILTCFRHHLKYAPNGKYSRVHYNMVQFSDMTYRAQWPRRSNIGQTFNSLQTPNNSTYLWGVPRQHFDGLVQDCSNSIANPLELLQSCSKPSVLNNCDIP